MKIIKKDAKLAEKEKILKERKLENDERRDKYLGTLKGNKLFQRYVVEEIIDFEIREAEKGTFKSMELLIKATPEEVKNIVVTKSANVLLLNKIKRLINGD